MLKLPEMVLGSDLLETLLPAPAEPRREDAIEVLGPQAVQKPEDFVVLQVY